MENIFKRLEFVIDHTEQVTKHFNGRERNEVMMFCMVMLDRLNFASEGLKVLLNGYLNNTKLDYPAGIVIRSVLLDHLIVLNAMEVYGNHLDDTTRFGAEMQAYCLMMLSDSVKNTLDYFEMLEGTVPADIMKNMYTNLVNMNPECFHPYTADGSKPVLKTTSYKSAKAIFKTLVNSKNMKSYASVYEAYLYYSKYDHFGQMFYSLARLKPLDHLAHIDQALKTFPRSLMFTITLLITFYPADEWLKTQLDDTMKFIDGLEGLS